MSKNLYIVPHDFSAVGDAALNYAIHLGKHVNKEIQVLHLSANKSENIRANSKLDKLLTGIELPNNVELTTLVREGSIFEDISKIAKKQGAQLIIMGTHGVSGMQRIFGSNAMKVVTSADTPFLIIQKETPVKDLKNILVPIDLTKESLQIINSAGDIAAMFNGEVHVIAEKQNDALLSQQMKNRIQIVKKQYEDRGIPCHIELLEASGSYHKKIMAYSNKNKIDLIAFAYHSERLLPQFDTFAQNLITNDQKLPCMVLNSKLASALYF